MFESYKQIPDDGRLIGFIVFDPSSQRIHESDLLVRGAKVKKVTAYYGCHVVRGCPTPFYLTG